MGDKTGSSDIRDQLSDAIHRSVTYREAQTIELLRRLIRTESMTGNEGTHSNPKSVTGILWDSVAGEIGITRDFQTVEPNRDNIIAIVNGQPGNTFVLDAHVDTVPLGNP